MDDLLREIATDVGKLRPEGWRVSLDRLVLSSFLDAAPTIRLLRDASLVYDMQIPVTPDEVMYSREQLQTPDEAKEAAHWQFQSLPLPLVWAEIADLRDGSIRTSVTNLAESVERSILKAIKEKRRPIRGVEKKIEAAYASKFYGPFAVL